MNLWDKFSGQFLFNLKTVAMNAFKVKVMERIVLSVFAIVCDPTDFYNRLSLT